jgi:CubicO group peptidase (beta-lactamase class C family)
MDMLKKIRAGTILALLTSLALAAAEFPPAKPEEVGLSAERLDRLGRVMQEYCDAGRVPGAVVLIARNGKAAYFKAFGKLDPVKGTAMPKDAIFRVASQTKAVTSVAIMTLFEEGKLLLTDPVSKYIPEFKGSRVAVQADDRGAAGYSTVPARREITIRDLLTHTAGISYGTGTAAAGYKKANVQGWFFADKDEAIGECVKRLAELPFDAQPGEKWVYGFNTDILGRVVEVASGMSLADYIARRIAEPLGMKDTHFFLPESKLDRFTPVYGVKKDGPGIELVEEPAKSAYVKGPRKCFSGGAGLLATAQDYASFLQMLCDGGRLGGKRVLGPKTVELMTSNHVGGLYEDGRQGFGLGFWIQEQVGRSGDPYSVGSFGWGGAYYTTYWVDPAEKLVAVLMIQMLPAPGLDLGSKFRSLVYQAIATSYAGIFAGR